jgi:adenylate kinase
MRLLIIGPPGAGKGTQSVLIAQKLEIPAISTGDIFRYNVKNETELGQKAKSYMDAGEYVPDSLTNELVRDRLGHDDAGTGFLLDGYPRTKAQVDTLDEILAEQSVSLDGVILLEANQDELVSRLANRAKEQGRTDDSEEVIRHRLDLYLEETAPLVNLYSERGILAKVDGLGEIDEVTERIDAAIASFG